VTALSAEWECSHIACCRYSAQNVTSARLLQNSERYKFKIQGLYLCADASSRHDET